MDDVLNSEDKAGLAQLPQAKGDPTIAQPDIDEGYEPGTEETTFSTRGQGYNWRSTTARDRSVLFGSGGHQDGVTALIQTNANRVTEDECALHGMGADTIDENRYQRNQANANTEFNFSQYKSGAFNGQRGKVLPGEGMFTVGNTDGLPFGDMMLKVDPYAAVVDTTTQALGAGFGSVWREEQAGMEHSNPKIAANPFAGNRGGGDEEDAEHDDAEVLAQVEEEEDGTGMDYYFDDEYMEGDDNVENDKVRNGETGLRRVNMRTTQGRQLEALATKEQITAIYQEANNNYAQVLKDHSQAYMSSEDRVDTLAKLRSDHGKYQAVQTGVNDLSRVNAQKARGTKNNRGPSKLGGQVVGA